MNNYAFDGLYRLSLVRVTNRVPPVLTNDQRARMLRPLLPSPTYNEHDWHHGKAARYARQEALDGRVPSTDTPSFTESTGGY